MIMQNSELDPQDQRKTSGMEDSTAMTIEFLRARLLSERSVSRSARQRADELAKRVMELEEQLKVVTLQRKMAEKATVDVLAILESQGISDMSEEFDFGSDQEMPCESGIGDDCAKDDERSSRRHISDELSGSDMDSSSVLGRSLSWKGRVDFPCSLEKCKTSNVRRRNNFSSISSSPKDRQGKSCRQIRRKETRFVVEESKDDPIQNKSKENEAMNSSEGFPNCSNDGSNILRKDSTIQGEDESEGKLAITDHDLDEYGREKDMEKALEHQAQLIGQYEAMEKAQREWEEKFQENHNSTPDSWDPGNHSDITEEREESKAQISFPVRMVTSNAQEAKSEAGAVSLSEEMAKTKPRSDMPPESNGDTGGNHNQKDTTVITSGFVSQENSHSQMNGKQKHESSGNSHHQPFDGLHQDSLRHDYPSYKPANSFPKDAYDRLPQENASRNQNDLYALVPHGQTHGLGGVLESLKQAKLSIQQELNKLPVVEAGYGSKAIKPSASLCKSEDTFEIPVGCSGLFRLPTDFSDGATARSGFSDSVSRPSSNFYLDKGNFRNFGDHGSSPYSGTRLTFPAEDQSIRSIANQYIESGSRFDAKRPPSDPFLDRGLSSSDKYMYPTVPIHPSYPKSTPQTSFGNGFSRQVPSRPVGVPPADNFSFYDNQARPNMYR